jgi:hypothetical protein
MTTTQVEYPREINGIIYNTPEELKAYADSLKEAAKATREALKEIGAVGKAPSQRKVFAELVSRVLNENASNELMEKLSEVEEDTSIRIVFNKSTGMFEYPVQKSSGGSGEGAPRGGKPLTVDGVEYPSARNARDTLHPDMVGKSQNRQAIINFLKHEDRGHTVQE